MIVMEALSRQSRVTGISSRPFVNQLSKIFFATNVALSIYLIPVNFRKNSLTRKYSRVYIYIIFIRNPIIIILRLVIQTSIINYESSNRIKELERVSIPPQFCNTISSHRREHVYTIARGVDGWIRIKGLSRVIRVIVCEEI